jgi:hypothetical protein
MNDASQGEIESHLKRRGFRSGGKPLGPHSVKNKTEPDGRAMIGLE